MEQILTVPSYRAGAQSSAIHVLCMSCTHRTISYISQLRNKLFIFAIFPPWHQPLESRGMRISINIHQERRRHKMRSLLSLFIQHIVICIADQWSVIRMEEHLVWNLREKQFSKEINGHLQLSCCFGTAPIPITHKSYTRDQQNCYDREQIPTTNVFYYQGLVQKINSKICQQR